jgi:hypothetical protein
VVQAAFVGVAIGGLARAGAPILYLLHPELGRVRCDNTVNPEP